MRLVVLQSNYLPWKGYFDLMDAADLFVVYDSVQYTKNDWRNRNRIATKQGLSWLTIPVATAGRADQAIQDARVQDSRWVAKHWRSIEQNSSKRPHFGLYRDTWSQWFDEAASLEHLHDINLLFLRGLSEQLEITTPIEIDSKYLPLEGTPTARLVDLCRRTGATSYLTGPAGLTYLEKELFVEAGVALEVIDYGQYLTYDQAGDEFAHGVSVVDLLMNTGPEARSHLLGAISTVQPE